MASHQIRIGTTKVKTGCFTCRSRRIKCDETWVQKSCMKCLKSCLTCSGPPTVMTRSQRYIYYVPGGRVSSSEGDQEVSTQHARHAVTHPATLALRSSYVDPFDVLPISSTPGVQFALTNLFRIHFLHIEQTTKPKYVALALCDPLLYETLLAYSKMSLRFKEPPEKRLSADIRVHMSHVLQQLQSALADSHFQRQDILVLVIYYLSVLYQAGGDMKAFAAHRSGLEIVYESYPPQVSAICGGFLTARLKSAEIYAKYLAGRMSDGKVADATSSGNSIYDADACANIPATFRGLVASGKLSKSGVKFLANIDLYLERPYARRSMDYRSTLLALRMVESEDATTYPPHALNGKDCPN